MAALVLLCVVGIVLWANLFKPYPIDGKRQMLAIAPGDTYTRFIDRMEKDGKISLPIVLKIYQKFLIHDSLKAGVYEIRQGMSIRQVMVMLSNAENAQMNRILVIEGTTFKQLIENLKKDPLVTKTVVNLPYSEMLKASLMNNLVKRITIFAIAWQNRCFGSTPVIITVDVAIWIISRFDLGH